MTNYYAGWDGLRLVDQGIQAGALGAQSIEIPEGECHALPDITARIGLCGKRIGHHTTDPWRSSVMGACPVCSEMVGNVGD